MTCQKCQLVGKRHGQGIFISLETGSNLNYLQIKKKYSILINYIMGQVTGYQRKCIKSNHYFNKFK